MEHFSLVILVLGVVLCIVLAHRLARKKGRNPRYWGFMAGVFGPLVFPVLLLLKPRKSDHQR